MDAAVEFSDIVMIAVPTPTIDGRISLNHVLRVSTQIGITLGQCSAYKLVVIRSTVVPSSTRKHVVPVLESAAKKQAGADFGVCVNPEFLRERTALEDFLSPDRILIGELDERSGRVLENLYESFQKQIIRCSLEEAELAKYVANGFLATKISYFNEVHKVCKKLDANPQVVSLAVALDRRIGSYGTQGGRRFDGKCLPKDIDAFLTRARELGENLEILSAAARVNKGALLEECLTISG